MTVSDIEKKYEDLISSYIEIKPVLNDLKNRNGHHFIDGILNEMRAINDHVARYMAQENEIDKQYDELCKAEGHLKRLIYDTFKQLNIIFYDYTHDFESEYFGKHWLIFDKGRFWDEYTSKINDLTKTIEQAKLAESRDYMEALNLYQNAYVIQGHTYSLIERNMNSLKSSSIKRLCQKLNSFTGWLVSTIMLAIIPALLWEAYDGRKELAEWFCSIKNSSISSIIELLQSLT